MNSQTTYLYLDREMTREELREKAEADSGQMDSGQWIDGEFDFDDWLADSLVTGKITKLHTDE